MAYAVGRGRRVLVAGLVFLMASSAQGVDLVRDAAEPQVAFGASAIREALAATEASVQVLSLAGLGEAHAERRVVLTTTADAAALAAARIAGAAEAPQLKPEGFCIRRSRAADQDTLWITGADAAGAMYGALDLAESLRLRGWEGVEECTQNPYMAMRGTKFNIPLDARTPSYTDPCDAAQKNIATVWDLAFWKEYLDNLARNRYNFVSLWSLHPFPSMVKVPEYPDIALDDVKRSTVQWKEHYSHNGLGFDAPEILNNLETLKVIGIDEKIAFWREVMAYAKERNIDFYVVTWNIFVNGTHGKYGITDDFKNEATIDYFRQSVKQMFLTYPDLAGIGLTTGENMGKANTEEKEDWAFRTYGQGVLDAAAAQPGRPIRFIHRQHQAGAKAIAERFAALVENPDIDFIFSFKYAKAHVHSSTIQTYHQEFVDDIGDMKTIWTLRNDDTFYFRWGAPDFVREFIRNIPYEVSQGWYLGSDQYIWGREFMSTEPDSPRQLEVVKHWYQWMLWGRLGYDPGLSDERFAVLLGEHFQGVPGDVLLEAWQAASMVYPLTTGFHWGSLDFQWYIEACKSFPAYAKTESGFNDVNFFIELRPHPGTGYMSIPDYVKAVQAGKPANGPTPFDIADRLDESSGTALRLLKKLDAGDNKELRRTLGDIRAVSYLGRYYARKIRGATEVALYRETQDASQQEAAVAALNQAAHYWRAYAAVALGQYENPLWTNRVGYCDWRKLMDDVLHDIEIAGGTPEVRSFNPTAGGTIHEAENAEFNGASRASDVPGFTGDGYVVFGVKHGPITWTIDAPADGVRLLEFRYSVAPGNYPAQLTVNGESQAPLILWTPGSENMWVWDHKLVTLKKGRNTVRLSPSAPALVDHVNVF